MKLAYDDYRKLLRDALSERSETNRSYSLRAFARDMKMTSSRLSEVLNNKKGLSKRSGEKVARCLGFTKEETKYFCDLIESVDARSEVARSVALSRIQAQRSNRVMSILQMDAFKVISDWYHFGIVNLMHLKSFRDDTNWIAETLSIDPSDVTAAIERLCRLEMIEKKEGQWTVVQDYVTSPDGVPSEAIRKFHRQILEKASLALSTQSVEERDMTALIMPVNTRKLGIARERIRAFRKELCKELDTGDDVDQVYCLSMQLFSLTKGTPV